MNEFQNTNIQITEIEAKMSSTGNMKYTLTAQDKKKYFFFQKNKGKDCEVFQNFNAMEVKKGSLVSLGFTEEQKSFINTKGETITYTDRFIGSMREASDIPMSKPSGTTTVTPKDSDYALFPEEEFANVKPQAQDKFGTRLALHGFVNARLQNHTIQQVKAEVDELLALEEFLNGKLQ